MHARRPRAAPRPARCGHACVEPQHHGIERSQDVVHGTADSKPMLGMSESLVSSFSEELQRVFVAAIEQLQAELKSAKCVTLESELLRVKNVAAASQQEMVVKWRHIVNDTFRRTRASERHLSYAASDDPLQVLTLMVTEKVANIPRRRNTAAAMSRTTMSQSTTPFAPSSTLT